MKLGDLITHKPEHTNLRFPNHYLIVGQVQFRNDWELAEYPCFIVLNKHGEFMRIPLSSVFAYEVFSEAA